MAEELYKQPAESRLYNFDFSNLLATGETISSINSVVQANLGKVVGSSDLTLGSTSNTTNLVQVRISAGTVNESYKLTALVTTTNNNIIEVDGILHIKEL